MAFFGDDKLTTVTEGCVAFNRTKMTIQRKVDIFKDFF